MNTLITITDVSSMRAAWINTLVAAPKTELRLKREGDKVLLLEIELEKGDRADPLGIDAIKW